MPGPVLSIVPPTATQPRASNARETAILPPAWGGEAWIVGGGPSAQVFDLRRLDGKRVLAVNDAVFTFSLGRCEPSAVSVFSLDHVWVRRHCDWLAAFEGEKHLAVPLETWPDVGGIEGAVYLRRSSAAGLSLDPGVINAGCNSGYGAIGLCFLKGAKEIHLVGYDMDPKDNENFVYWAPLFRTMLPQLKASGISVFNHSRNSFIDAFLKVR